MTKKQQTVGLLLGMKHKDADAMIGDLVCASDFHTAYFVLAETFHHLKSNQMDALFGLSISQDRLNAILQRCRSVHGEITDLILPVLEEQERQSDIILRRASITGEEHRFFLALLLNVPSREKILDLVKERFPEQDPVETILDWVEELSQTKVLGLRESNVLGIEGFDDGHMFVLECLLGGLSEEEIRTRIKTVSPAEYAPDLEGRLDPVIDTLRGSILSSAVFAG